MGHQKKSKVQGYHAYLRIHGDRVNPLIEERWRTHQDHQPQQPKIAFIAGTAREFLEQESEEVKNQVKDYREGIKQVTHVVADDASFLDGNKVHSMQRSVKYTTQFSIY